MHPPCQRFAAVLDPLSQLVETPRRQVQSEPGQQAQLLRLVQDPEFEGAMLDAV
jgi:hypothetical protein